MFIEKIIRNLFLKEVKIVHLGRWNLCYCNKVNRKIDLANYDNCGTCGNIN